MAINSLMMVAILLYTAHVLYFRTDSWEKPVFSHPSQGGITIFCTQQGVQFIGYALYGSIFDERPVSSYHFTGCGIYFKIKGSGKPVGPQHTQRVIYYALPGYETDQSVFNICMPANRINKG